MLNARDEGITNEYSYEQLIKRGRHIDGDLAKPSNKVLFVDDELKVLLSLKRCLRSQYDIDAADSGEEALRRIDEGADYGVIVSDLRMPHMDGITFLREAKKKSPNATFIILTGAKEHDCTFEAVVRLNVTKYLFKPCAIETLHLALKEGLTIHAANCLSEAQPLSQSPTPSPASASSRVSTQTSDAESETRRFREQICALTALRAGEWPLANELFAVGELFDDCTDYVRRRARPQGVMLDALCSVGRQTLTGDLDVLAQALKSALIKAVEYTPEGGQIGFYADRGQNNVFFTIYSNHKGFDVSRASRQPVGPVPAIETLAGRVDQPGLELTLARELFEYHRGDLILSESPTGEGIFAMATLPIV